MNTTNPLAQFDPHRLAYYEKENYVAYYQKSWFKLLRVSIAMVKEAFNLPFLQAALGAYMVARAEIAFSPFPDNDIPKAEAYMRRFFSIIQRVHHLDFDIPRLARAEVNWWSVHRQLFGQIENQELVDALAESYLLAYGDQVSDYQEAAYNRAMGMYYSDVWVNNGKEPGSHLLLLEEQSLSKGYTALKFALTGKDQAAGEESPDSRRKEEYNPGYEQTS